MSSTHESYFTRYLVAPCLLITTTVAVLLFLGNAFGWTIISIYDLVVTYRASIQIVVQVLSAILGGLHVFTLTTLVNFRTRLLLSSRQPISLDVLNWWNRLCNRSFPGLGLSGLLFFALLAFWGITTVPAALWAGAITPVITTTQSLASIAIPQYTSDINQQYWNRTDEYLALGSESTNSTPYGEFSFFPVYPFGGRILDTAASSTKTPNLHSKYDISRYSFLGRSFGVGSSVGVSAVSLATGLNTSSIETYTYLETGYRTNVSCLSNTTSSFIIGRLNSTWYANVPINFWVTGILPNSELNYSFWNVVEGLNVTYPGGSIGYPVVGFMTKSPVVALAAVSANERNVLGIASAGFVEGTYPKYAFLNQTQCDVTFTPRTFQVLVNVSELLIQVTDVGEADELGVDPTTAKWGSGMGVIAQRSLLQIMLLSYINTSLYTSVVGDAFFSSVQNLYDESGDLANFPNDTQRNILGVEQAFESMLDDMLISFSGAQSMITPGGSHLTAVNATIGAVAIGEGKYIYAILALNLLLAIIFIAEAARTRGWRKLKKFDYRDLRCLVVATANGRNLLIPDKKLPACKDNGSGAIDFIIDPTDEVAIGKLDVKFGDDGNTLVLVRRASRGAAARKYPNDTEETNESIPLGVCYHAIADSAQQLLVSPSWQIDDI